MDQCLYFRHFTLYHAKMLYSLKIIAQWPYIVGSCRVGDRMVVGFTTSYIIGVHHHYCCEFESRSWRGAQHYVMKFLSDLRQVGGFLCALRFPPLINWPPRYNWNNVESGVKHHKTKQPIVHCCSLQCICVCIFLLASIINLIVSSSKQWREAKLMLVSKKDARNFFYVCFYLVHNINTT